MNSLWNFDNGFPIQDPQFNDSPWVPVMEQQQQQQQSNWPELGSVSSGYLHEIPNPNAVPADEFFGFDFDFGHHKESSVPMPYQQGLGIGYPNGSLSDILVSGDAGYNTTPSVEQNLKRSIAPETPILDLNFPADDSSVWPEFDPEPLLVIPSQSSNPGSSLVTGDYSGGMALQVIEDLNLTPVKEIENPLPTTKPVQFAPETPDHQAQLERQELNAILISLTDETEDHATDKGKTVVNSSSDELLQNIVDPYMQKEGNGSITEEAFDLNKTPNQKPAAPKRRKYTPKVIKENKPQRGRKSTTTPKAAAQTSKAAETPPKSVKRKYVRKQGTEAEVTPPPAQQAEGNMNTQEPAKRGGRSVPGQKTAKRALNFDLEDTVEANRAIRAQFAPQVSNLYTRSSVPYAQNHQQGGGTLEGVVNESSVLRNQNLNINLRPQVPGPYSSSIPPVQMSPQLHASVSRQSRIPNQHRPELGNLRFHTGTIVGMGMGRTAFPQQCNNPGEGFQGRLTNLNNAVNSRQALLSIVSQAMLSRARGNQLPPSEQQQCPPVNPSSVWQRMLSTFPAAHQRVNVQQNIAGRTDLPSQGRSISAANDADWGESGIFRNGFLQAMAEAQCLGQQHNLYEQQQQQLSAPSRNETSVVTQLQDTAPMSQANRAEPVTPEKIEKLKNQNAAQVNKRGRKRLDLSNPEPINPTNNVQKGQRGRPPKIQPSVSDTRVPCTASNYTSMVNQLTNRIAALDLSVEAGAIVPYMGGDGALVPYDARKRKIRPKVDLDPETSRVWNVLMGKEASDEHEDKDLKKEKWWQTEREVFRGRAESFIARMHQVQGDRRFSRWKGSVVDSVIGVFLTQNVSDHLSSSAFMALVAAFPAKSRDPSRDNSKSIIVEEPEDFMLNANKLQPDFSFELNRSPVADHSIIWRDCFSSPTDRTSILEAQSHSTEEEGISSQGSCVTPLEDLSQKSEGINDSTSKAYQVSENGSSQSNYEGCEQTDLAGQKQVELVDGFSDGFYPPGFENQHFPVPSVSSNLHHLEMNLKMTTVEVYDDESASTSSKRPRVAETMQAGNTQVAHNSTTGGSHPERKNSLEGTAAVKAKGKKALVEEKIDWDKLRRDAQAEGRSSERSSDAMDTLDYETIRKTPVEKISNTIRARGMNNMLAERIKDFLDRLVEDHGSVDLEWLRDVPPDMAKDYLLSIRGLGLKSVECVRLLTLHNLAFPVDTNVGRIAVRLGWVPLEPLPEALQIHLLEVYPLLESVQKYLWPRLCKLDQRTLYELHYQLITFGKVFCTKTKPNCNACPMRGDCRHFASAFASAKLALPGPEEKKIVSCDVPLAESAPHVSVQPTSIHRIEAQKDPASNFSVLINSVQPYHMEDKAADQQGPGGKTSVQPIIEEPASPEPDISAVLEHDIEDWYVEDDEDEIPTINLNMEAFTKNLERVIQENNGDLDGPSMSRALVALDPRLSSLPTPQLKNISRLRTEHHVYELPDDHYLLLGMQRREVDDPSPYLLAIWAPGETKDSTQLPESTCRLQAAGNMCNDQTCFSCNSMREDELQVVRGTILIPCRTAMKGSFPLNGTYFQVNEMFADHESSHNPINVPRNSIWNLRRRIVYFGTSVTSIFRGLTTEQIQHCFWRGFVCVRAFDRLSGAPRPLVKRLHQVASKAKPSDEE